MPRRAFHTSLRLRSDHLHKTKCLVGLRPLSFLSRARVSTLHRGCLHERRPVCAVPSAPEEDQVRWLVRFVVTTVMALAGAVVSIDSSSLRDSGWWMPGPSLVVACIVAIALGLIWQYIDAEIERRRVRRRTSLANEISKLMFPLWHEMQSLGTTKRTRERIGLHVWMVPTWHWTLVPDWLRSLTPQRLRDRLPTPRLWRAAQFRLQDDHEPTDIRWKRDVGAIGICWRERHRQHFVMRDLWDEDEYTAEAWEQLPAEDKLGFNYEQYRRIWHKYDAVLAWPIYKYPTTPGSQFIGCIVVDALVGHPVHFDRRSVRGKLYNAANEIANRIGPIQR